MRRNINRKQRSCKEIEDIMRNKWPEIYRFMADNCGSDKDMKLIIRDQLHILPTIDERLAFLDILRWCGVYYSGEDNEFQYSHSLDAWAFDEGDRKRAKNALRRKEIYVWVGNYFLDPTNSFSISKRVRVGLR